MAIMIALTSKVKRANPVISNTISFSKSPSDSTKQTRAGGKLKPGGRGNIKTIEDKIINSPDKNRMEGCSTNFLPLG